MTTPSVWVLSLMYWLHMLATVVWLGSLASLSIFILPFVQGSLDKGAYARLLEGVQRRLGPLGWFCLTILVSTGLFQMSANPNYQGLLNIHNRWALAIFLKHLVFALVVALSAYITWVIHPKLYRLALSQAQGKEVPQSQRLQKQEVHLMRLNLILGLIILALTALARAS